MIYNIRHDRGRTQEIAERIRREKQVSQGWGGGTSGNLDLRTEDFVKNTRSWYGLSTTRIATNLSRMKEFRDDDILVLPRLPEYETVSLHIVDGDFPSCYEYDSSDSTDLNHRIKVKRSFGMNGELHVRSMPLVQYHAKLPWLRLPVLPMPQFESIFAKLVEEMSAESADKTQYGPAELDDFLRDMACSVDAVVTKEMRKIHPIGGAISFEELCKKIVVGSGYGYEVVDRNKYNREGGDLDLICQRPGTVFETEGPTLCIQIKKHEKKTGKEAVKQVVGMLGDQPSAHGCVMSAADGFTEEAEKMAYDHGIKLLNRRDIFRLLMPQLPDYLDPEGGE